MYGKNIFRNWRLTRRKSKMEEMEELAREAQMEAM